MRKMISLDAVCTAPTMLQTNDISLFTARCTLRQHGFLVNVNVTGEHKR